MVDFSEFKPDAGAALEIWKRDGLQVSLAAERVIPILIVAFPQINPIWGIGSIQGGYLKQVMCSKQEVFVLVMVEGQLVEYRQVVWILRQALA